MIKLENYEVVGWEHAIRGMRNPKNSWDRMDSLTCTGCKGCNPGDECNRYKNGTFIGPNDHKLMMALAKGGPVHAKYRRMITVYVDITAPLYWWKEFDTYKIGTVANSCSTMHKLTYKEFEVSDFSTEKLTEASKKYLCDLIMYMNQMRACYEAAINPEYKETYWHQMIQLLPTSYNQKRTVMLNYEVLANIYKSRKNHKLDEWRKLCEWIEGLPYSEIITGIEKE